MKTVEIIKVDNGLELRINNVVKDHMSEGQVTMVLQNNFGFRKEDFKVVDGKEYAEEYYDKCDSMSRSYRHLCTGVHGTVNWNQALAEAYAYPIYKELVELRYMEHVAFKIAIGSVYERRIVNPSETKEIQQILDKHL